MKALLKKDANWLLFFLTFGTAVPLCIFQEAGFEKVWINPDMRTFPDVMTVWWISAIALGAFGAIRDELTRTDEYLRHRPVSRAKIFCVKVGACLALVAIWLAAPLIFQMLFPGLWDQNASIARWGRFWTYLGAGTLAFSGFGAAFCAGSLRVGWIWRIVIGGALEFGLFVGITNLAVSFGDQWASALWLHVILHLGLTALFLVIAYGNYIQGRDPDRSLTGKTHWLTAIAVGLGLMLTSGHSISLTQDELRTSIFGDYPWIVEMPDGEFRLVKTSKNGQGYLECDADHQPTGPFQYPETSGTRNRHCAQWWPFRAGWDEIRQRFRPVWHRKLFNFGDSWDRVAFFGGHVTCYLNRSTGTVHLFRTSAPGNEGGPSVVTVPKENSKEPFSRDVEDFRIRGNHHVAMIGDRSDGTIWRYHIREGKDRFERLPLPDNDRFREVVVLSSTEAQIVKDGQTYEAVNRTYVKGERGVYSWNGTAFENAPEELKIEPAGVEKPAFVVAQTDPIAPAVEYRDSDGKALFAHEYRLHDTHQKCKGFCVYALSVLRAPLFQVASFIQNPSIPRMTFCHADLVDPLISGQKRMWLPAANLLFALVLAVFTARRLARLGASRGRCLFWAAFVLVGGVMVAVLCFVLETRRAYRVSPVVEAETAPAMLIHSKV